jgi:hypothetical protein
MSVGMNETQNLREVMQELSQLRQRPCVVLHARQCRVRPPDGRGDAEIEAPLVRRLHVPLGAREDAQGAVGRGQERRAAGGRMTCCTSCGGPISLCRHATPGSFPPSTRQACRPATRRTWPPSCGSIHIGRRARTSPKRNIKWLRKDRASRRADGFLRATAPRTHQARAPVPIRVVGARRATRR